MGEATLRCPLCDYDVRGLPEPRCPECGHRFEWAELTDPSKQRVKWLFEHRKWLGGYVSTQWRLLVPWRFWRELRPAHRLVPRRVVLFFLVAFVAGPAILFAAATAATYAALGRGAALNRQYFLAPATAAAIASAPLAPGWTLPPNPTLADVLGAQRGMTGAQFLAGLSPPTTLASVLRMQFDLVRNEWRQLAFPMCLLASPALGALLVLGIMRQSFAQAKVKPGHAIRVAIYSGDILLLLVMLLLVAGASVAQGRLQGGGGVSDLTPLALVIVALGCLAHIALRLENGVRIYLGVRRAWAVVLAWLIISPLLGLALAVILSRGTL